MINGSVLGNRCLNSTAVSSAVAKLNRYRLNKTIGAACAVKIAVIRKRKTCSRAEHKENGIINIVSRRKERERMMRVPIKAGTLQPKPMSNMTKLRPSSPNRAIKASIKNAARER